MSRAIWTVFEANMRALYEDAGAWDPAAKRAELFDTASRFLVAVAAGDGRDTRRSTRLRADALCGYVMWRFDVDDVAAGDAAADDGDAQIEVAYWYVAHCWSLTSATSCKCGIRASAPASGRA